MFNEQINCRRGMELSFVMVGCKCFSVYLLWLLMGETEVQYGGADKRQNDSVSPSIWG